MEEKIIIDRMDAEEFYQMLLDDAKDASKTQHQYYSITHVLMNIANEFRELCGGKAATDDWEE